MAFLDISVYAYMYMYLVHVTKTVTQSDTAIIPDVSFIPRHYLPENEASLYSGNTLDCPMAGVDYKWMRK